MLQPARGNKVGAEPIEIARVAEGERHLRPQMRRRELGTALHGDEKRSTEMITM